MKKKLFLIDGTALIYRAYYAFIRNPLITSKGENTSAIFGTVNMFLSFLDRYAPEYIMISFDEKGKTFRHELDSTYKSNRKPAPEEMIEQIAPIRRFFKLAGVKEVSISGYEADDVLVSAAKKFGDEFEIVIVTGDKDFAQIVDDNTVLYDPRKEQVIDRAVVIEKYGITPEQFIDYLAICGDSADNIPGVKGIGAKGAAKLLNEYVSLDGIYEHIEEISSKSVKKKLIEHKESAYRSRELATIITDLPLKAKSTDLRFKKSELAKTVDFLRGYELNRIAERVMPEERDIFSMIEEEKKEPRSNFEAILVETQESLDQLLSEIRTAGAIAIDTETTSTDALLAELVGISICFEESKSYYLPLSHKMAQNLEVDNFREKMEEALAGKLLIAHNYKYDYQVLRQSGWKLENAVFDTMIADYLLNPWERHSLDRCSQRYFDHSMIPITELIGKGSKQITFDLVGSRQACEYSAEDAWVTWRLYTCQQKEIKEAGLEQLYYEVEIPLLFVLADMERAGVYLDESSLKALRHQIDKRLGSLTQEIYKISEEPFNLNSTQQLGKILFEKLGIAPVKKTKTGYSTDQSVLEKLSVDHKIAELILEYRTLSKLLNTYVKALPALINPLTGRIHSSFNQAVATTGRLSSSNPNLQNIPIRTESGKEVRKAFCAKDADWCIVSADYSQIELRVFALLTRDETLIETFRSGKDIHSKTASLIYQVKESEITSDQRRYAKVINFGLLYGMGAYRISNELKISRTEAKEFIENYFANFPSVHKFIEDHQAKATEKGYVETILGRRLSLLDLNSKNRQRREAALRLAINMPVQGSAADLIKIAMNRLGKELAGRDDIRMLIQVHDELIFEVKKDVVTEARELIRQVMEGVLPEEYAGIVPLKVDIGEGDNWFEAH